MSLAVAVTVAVVVVVAVAVAVAAAAAAAAAAAVVAVAPMVPTRVPAPHTAAPLLPGTDTLRQHRRVQRKILALTTSTSIYQDQQISA